MKKNFNDEYIIVSGNYPSELKDNVNSKLKEKYEVVGGICVHPTRLKFYQAMIKKSKYINK